MMDFTDLPAEVEQLKAQVDELTKIVDALGPVVTKLLLAHKEAEREKVEGPPSIVSVADEDGEPWIAP